MIEPSGWSRSSPLDFLEEGVSRAFAVSLQEVIVQGFADSKSDIVPEYIEKRFYRWYESVSLGIGKDTKDVKLVEKISPKPTNHHEPEETVDDYPQTYLQRINSLKPHLRDCLTSIFG